MAALALKSWAPVGLVKSELGLSWWDEINESTQWQDGIFYTLCAFYALVSAAALIQLLRIASRVSGWTTQKIFILMNFIVTGVRATIFGYHMYIFALKPKAGNHPTDKLRVWYIAVA